MAAPSVSGIDFASINNFDSLTGITFTPNATNAVVESNFLKFRFPTNGVRQTASIPIPGEPINATDKYFLFWCFVANYTSPTPQIAFVDSSGRKKTFTITTQRGNSRFFLIDLSTTNYNTETSGFDQSSLSTIEMSVLGNSGFIDTLGVRFSRVAMIDRLTVTGGELGTPAKIQSIRDYLLAIDSSASFQNLNFIATTDFLETQHRVRIAADYFSEDSLSGLIAQDDRLETWNTVQNLGTTFFRQVASSFREVDFDLQNAQTVNSLIVDGYIFKNSSTPVIRFFNLNASGSPSLDFGSGELESSTITNSGIVSGGADYTSVSISNGTGSYALEWNGAATFESVSFSGSTAHYINCNGANFTDGATLDITGITFGTPGTRKIRVNAAGKTLNIQTAGGFTLSDVTVVAGTVNIVAPVVDYARGVSGAPVGAAIAIFKRISSLVADRSQFTLASGNNSGDSALVIAETIPNDTPESGHVRVLRDDGSEDRLAFTSWAGNTFALSGTLPATYTAGNGCYVGYVDVLGSSTGTESVDLEYVSDRNCVLVVRLGSGSGRIREIRQDITLTNQDQVVPVSGFADTINTTT
jgi:hypothetical protein